MRFDGRGYGLRSSEKYQTNLTLVFGTEDVRYQWLTKVVAVMEGESMRRLGGRFGTFMFPPEVADETHHMKAPGDGIIGRDEVNNGTTPISMF